MIIMIIMIMIIIFLCEFIKKIFMQGIEIKVKIDIKYIRLRHNFDVKKSECKLYES